ncbi:hypothetical protein H0H87_011310 [Tephrocybe sp. NHM501043]|nr:hypothetical protein H0H87_011310 [Tephrocybe sp. NHM501043]
MSTYNVARKYFVLTSLTVAPCTFIINAPFGRFTPTNQSSILLVDGVLHLKFNPSAFTNGLAIECLGVKSWIAMELVAPTSFLYTLLSSPTRPPLFSVQSLCASLYLLHYVNRALLSPLRTPSRSKSHVIVPLSGIMFNVINGFLLGTYLASSAARAYLTNALTRPTFILGIALWALGAAGNIWHDEILLNIRRKARSKGKARDGSSAEHYAIPHGGLYSLVSYPNYLCEWIEWAGFAIATSPAPLSLASLSVTPLLPSSVFESLRAFVQTPAASFAPSLTPPYIFFLNEVVLMLPRAVRGHKWYRDRFGATYPPERRAVIPFLL